MPEDILFENKNVVSNDFNFIYPLTDYDLEKIKKIILKNNQPTSVYVVQPGDTLWKISKKLGVKIDEILVLNDFKEDQIIKPGDKIVIPKDRIAVSRLSEDQGIKRRWGESYIGKFVKALKQVGNMIIPTSGFNWGIKHSNNGSDIAAPCGSEVYAVQDGIVIESSDGWNGGYGNYIIIRHSDFSYTLYGHLSLRLVERGEVVKMGDLIGYVGNTGYTLGPTGCHLHFEVRGKANPLLK